MAHNFTHSFVSDMNYVDDGYVSEDIITLARKMNGEHVVIHWIPEAVYPWALLTKRVKKGIQHYRNWLSDHLKNHNINRDAISEFRTDIYMNSRRGISVQAYVLDDHGKENICDVYDWV